MSRPGAWLCGVGAVTSVGGSARQTATSVRAGISRYAEVSLESGEKRPPVMALLPEDSLPPLAEELEDRGLSARERRMLRLAGPAVREALNDISCAGAPPLFLAVPGPLPGLPAPLDETIFERLSIQSGVELDARRSRSFAAGRAGGVQAIAAALESIDAGAEYALAAGIDTHLDQEVLGTLGTEDRLLREGAFDGFAPGEGAAFLLLAGAATVERDELEPMAFLHPPGLAREPGHRYSEEPNLGEGLTAAIRAGLAAADTAPIATVLCSLNGESGGAREWGVASLRNADRIGEDVAVIHPADCYGDPGAAAAALLVVLGAIGSKDGYIEGPCLVWCSSDRGLRGAIYVTAVAE